MGHALLGVPDSLRVVVEPAELTGTPVGGGTAGGNPLQGVAGSADEPGTTELPATSAETSGELTTDEGGPSNF